MPQIPVYDGPQVKVRALQPVMQRTPDVSSGLQSLARVAEGFGQIADRVVNQQADIEAFSAQERILKAQNDWEVEARRVAQGEKAVGYRQQVEDWWKTVREQEFSKLSPMAQARVSKALSASYRAAVEAAGNYERQQVEIGARSKLNGSLAQLQTQAIKAGAVGAPAVVQAGIDTIRAFGRERGVDVTPEITKFTSGVHLNLIEGMASQNAAEARRYFNENRDQIDSGTWDRVEKVIKAEEDNQFAKAEATRIYTLPAAERAAALAKITDPDRLAKTRTEFNNIVAVESQAQREREQAASDQAWQTVGAGKRPPETVLMQMNGRERVQLQDYLRERAKQAAAGTPVKTDFATWYELSNRIAAGEKIDLRPYATKISESDLQALTTKQQAVGKPGAQEALFTLQQRVEKTFPGLGIDPKRDPESAYAVLSEVDRRIRAASVDKKLTPDDEQKIVDSVVLDRVYVDEWGSDPQKPVAALTPEELSDAYVNVGGRRVKVSSVPMADRQQITAALRAAGRPATEQAIVELYLRAQQQKTPNAAR